MGIITKEVEVRPRGAMIAYYQNMGYDAKYNQLLTIKVEDLSNGSYIKIDVLCDCCKEVICNPTYRDYRKRVEKFGDYSCYKCRSTHQKESCITKYGFNTPSKNEEVKEKARMTNLKKYGVTNSMQSPRVRAKANETLCKNGTQKTSKQQLYLHSLYGGEINYPVSYYAIDICFPEEKLAIEYDGGGHDLRVTLGRLTQEEFNQKEIIRNSILKKAGYKRINIASKLDLLPSDQILLDMLTYARNYFSEYPNHSWIEFNIDTFTLRNAEHKDGILYDYGELRKISS